MDNILLKLYQHKEMQGAKTNLVYQYGIDKVSVIFGSLYFNFPIIKLMQCISYWEEDSKLRSLIRKKERQRASNTSFYVVPYPADTVLLEKPMTC